MRKKQTIFTITVALLALFAGSLIVYSLSLPGTPQDEGDQESFLPLVSSRYDPDLDTPIFGVQMYGNTSSSSKYHDDLIASKTSWLRVAISWKSAEPTNVTPDQYNWSAIDTNLSAARTDMGALNLIANIDSGPEWAVESTSALDGPIKAEYLPEFAEFVGALVERYDGDGIDDAPSSPIILHWEFYNEPDRRTRWGEDGELYKEMLAAVYPAAKAANPQAQVVFGGIAFDWFYETQGGPFMYAFLDDVLSAGGGAYFDIMNFHAYPSFAQNWTSQGPGILEKTQAVREKLQNYSLEKPIIITEAGWHNSEPSNDEIQLRYVVQFFVQAMAADVDVLIWWMLYDPTDGLYPHESGLVTGIDNPPQRKLSFYTYQTMVQELSTAHFVRRLSDGETGDSRMEAYLFQDNAFERKIYVAWLDPVDTTSTGTLRITAEKGTVRNIINGTTTTILDAQDGKNDGRITVTISGRPGYIEIDQ